MVDCEPGSGAFACFFGHRPGAVWLIAAAICDNGRMSVHLVFCTCPDSRVATGIAETLVNEGLAACVSQLPGMTSIYRWQGAICRSREVQLLIKTGSGQSQAAMERIKALHPFELPEILVVEATSGLPAYLDWVQAETRKDV